MGRFIMVDCQECGTPEIGLNHECPICGKAVCEHCYENYFVRVNGELACPEHRYDEEKE